MGCNCCKMSQRKKDNVVDTIIEKIKKTKLYDELSTVSDDQSISTICGLCKKPICKDCTVINNLCAI